MSQKALIPLLFLLGAPWVVACGGGTEASPFDDPPPSSETSTSSSSGSSSADAPPVSPTPSSSSSSTTGSPAPSPGVLSGNFHFAPPTRVADSRNKQGFTGRFSANQEQRLTIGDIVVPAASREGLHLNVAVTNPSGGGFLTIYPCNTPRPTTSSINFIAGQTVANSVVVGNGSDICFYSGIAASDVVVDVVGVYAPNGLGLIAVDPFRLYESGEVNKLAPNVELPIVAAGANSIPSNARGALLNVAVVPEADGYLTVYECGTSPNGTSTMNFKATQATAIAVPAKFDGAGQVCMKSTARARVIVDAFGAFSKTSGSIVPMNARAYDSRETGKRTSDLVTIPVVSKLGIPPKANGILINLVATDYTGPGYATIAPCGAQAVVDVSSVNFSNGRTTANLTFAAPNVAGEICLYSSEPTHVILDVVGYTMP